jgi:hypothetical protein
MLKGPEALRSRLPGSKVPPPGLQPVRALGELIAQFW